MIVTNDACETLICDCLPDKQLFGAHMELWFANTMNYLVTGEMHKGWNKDYREHFFSMVGSFIWDEPCLNIIQTKSLQDACLRIESIVLSFCLTNLVGPFCGRKIVVKILQSGFYWSTLFRDAHNFYKRCLCCQQLGKIGRKNMMLLSPIIIVDISDVWGIDFMWPFSNSFGNEYILLCVDYMSNWVHAIPIRTNESRVVMKFLKESIFAKYRMSQVIIGDQGIHFDDRSFDALLLWYSILHYLTTPKRTIK